MSMAPPILDAAEHEEFITEQLFPLLVDYADRVGLPPESIALVSFLALSLILQSRGGMDREALIQAIEAVTVPPCEASETLQ